MLDEKKIQILNMIHKEIDSGSYVSRIHIYSDKSSSKINNIVDYVLTKHKKSQKVVSKSKKRLPWKQIVSVALVLFMLLAAIPYVMPPLYGDFGSDVSIVLDPNGVRLNDTLFINMTIPSSYNIKSVSADMAGVDTVDLLLVDNSTSLHLWQGVWLVHGIVPDEHIMTITAMDEFNMSYSAGVRLSILAEEVPPIDNESSMPDKNETVPPEINDVNETSNQTIISSGLNLLLQSDKDVYIVNETVLIQGVVSYNNSLINTSVNLLVVGPDYNLSVSLDVSDGRFSYGFVLVVVGGYVVNATISYLNESVQEELVFDVLSIPIENVSTVSILDAKIGESVYVVPGTSFYVDRTIGGLNGTDVYFAPLFSDSLIIERIEIISNSLAEEKLKVKETLISKDYRLGNGVSKSEKKLDKIREKLIDKMDKLDNAVLSDLLVLNEPLKLRVWFKAPSWDEIKSGGKDSSGRISYLVYSDSDDDYDFEGSTWWNSDWSYRKIIPILNANNSYQMQINVTKSTGGNVTCEGHCNNDFGDIRFVNADNTTLLDYWIEESVSGNYATIWVETPSDIETDRSIIMYYGNSGAPTTSNATNTFLLYDNFSGTSLDTSKWDEMNSGTGTITVSGGTITIASGGDWWSTADTSRAIVSKTSFTGNYIAEAYIVRFGLDNWNRFFGLRSGSATNSNVFVLLCDGDRSHITNVYRDSVGGSANWYGENSGITNPGANKIAKFERVGDTVYSYYGGTLTNTRTVSGWGLNYVSLTDTNTNTNPAEFDWIRVRGYASTVPSWGTIATEEGLPVVSNPIPADSATQISVPPVNFSITVNDQDGDIMNISWLTNESGTWTIFNTSTNIGNGTYNVTNTSWVDSYLTIYWWSVNVTDGKGWTNLTYSFTSRPQNYAPTINNAYPENQSTAINLQITCSIYVNDLDIENLNVSWYNSTDGVNWTHQQNNNSVDAGSTVYWNYSQANSYSTVYYWKVAVNDSKENITVWYKFTTKSTDSIKPSSNLTAISKYWHKTEDNPLTIICTDAQDDTGGDGIKNVTLYFYYSTNNITWNGPFLFGVDTDPWVSCSWSFTFSNDTGFYHFYCCAADNNSNIEDAPSINDTLCGYDVSIPSSYVDNIIPYELTNSTLLINASTSDTGSGINNVALYYSYSADNSSFGINWWNKDWTYRKVLPINNANNSYQMQINVTKNSGGNITCNGHCRDDFGDIRFVDAGNTTALDFWIEESSSGNYAIFWVETPSDIETDKSINLYYGNNSATTTSNSSNTFLLYDNFSGTSLDTTKWDEMNSGTGTITVSGGTITIASSGDWWSTADSSRAIVSKTSFIDNYIAEAYIVRYGLDNYNRFFGLRSGSATNSKVFVLLVDSDITHITNVYRDTTGGSADWYGENSGIVNPGVNKIAKFERVGNIVNSYYDGSLTNSRTVANWDLNYVSLTDTYSSSNPTEYDWILVRKYASTTPLWGTSSNEQTIGWMIWNNISNPDTSAPWQWIFNFPNSTGYYKFYSIATDIALNSENIPSSADTSCYFNQNTSIDITPNIWNIGNISIGNTTNTSGFYFNLTNNGNIALNIQIKTTNATNTSTGALWELNATPDFDKFSLQYNRSDLGVWTNINLTYDTFITNLAIGNWKTFDLKLLTAITSTKSDPLSVTITFRSVVQ
jgi:hypothetical protein